ncbi:hypothetical protein ACFOM8_01825 [Paracoccus angustae]|uniref:DUF2188 domain-containing protein n=1 Tax=Paracoccus angustae TaxID=1671480 RepID=A0ABV7TZM7_9RHOB
MAQTGYWKNRGFYQAYFNGHWIGAFASPEAAHEAVEKARRRAIA